MNFKVVLLWRAERDLDHILLWLNERSPQGAANWLRAWDKTFAILESSADTYGLSPESEDHQDSMLFLQPERDPASIS
jgi:plasmid stabilization system protein ParE